MLKKWIGEWNKIKFGDFLFNTYLVGRDWVTVQPGFRTNRFHPSEALRFSCSYNARIWTTTDVGQITRKKDSTWRFQTVSSIEFFTISPQYKNANIANFVLALSLKLNQSNVAFDLKM